MRTCLIRTQQALHCRAQELDRTLGTRTGTRSERQVNGKRAAARAEGEWSRGAEREESEARRGDQKRAEAARRWWSPAACHNREPLACPTRRADAARPASRRRAAPRRDRSDTSELCEALRWWQRDATRRYSEKESGLSGDRFAPTLPLTAAAAPSYCTARALPEFMNGRAVSTVHLYCTMCRRIH